MIRFALPLLACFLWSAPSARSAVAIRVLAWDHDIADRKLSLVNGANLVPIVHMHPLKRTEVFRVTGDGGVVVRATDKGLDPDGKPFDLPVKVGEIKRPLLLLLPDPKHPTGLRGMVIDDGTEGFKWGSFRFFNTTDKELVVQFDQKAISVPGGWKPVNFEMDGEPRGFAVRVATREEIEQPLYTAAWEYDPEVRTVVFMVPGNDPRESPVSFKAIPEEKISASLDPAP
jgi:hypothetical protein